jgi:hypothetical protein
MVRTWFISAIHNDLLDDIIYICGERLEYTDEFLRKFRKVLLGGDHIHKIWDTDSGKIVRSNNVDFNEDGDEDDH